jgi:hypothetical protein
MPQPALHYSAHTAEAFASDMKNNAASPHLARMMMHRETENNFQAAIAATNALYSGGGGGYGGAYTSSGRGTDVGFATSRAQSHAFAPGSVNTGYQGYASVAMFGHADPSRSCFQ